MPSQPSPPGSTCARPPRRRARYVAAACALALPGVALGAASCGGSDSGGTTTTKSSTTASGPLSARALTDKVQRSTVSIVTQPPGETRKPAKHGKHAHGSGVVWDASKGWILTSDHLVENAATEGGINATVNGATEVPGRLVARAQCNDFAIIELADSSGLVNIERGKSSALKVGDEVTAFGFFKSATATKATPIRTSGEVASVNVAVSVTPDLPDFPSVVLHQAPLKEKQMSGGPLVDGRGRLVGLDIVVPPADGSAIGSGPYAAVSSDYLQEKIGALKVGAGGHLTNWKDQHTCHGDMVKIANRVLVKHGAPGAHHH